MRYIVVSFLMGALFMFVLCGAPNFITGIKYAVNYNAVESAWASGWIEGFNSKLHERW